MTRLFWVMTPFFKGHGAPIEFCREGSFSVSRWIPVFPLLRLAPGFRAETPLQGHFLASEFLSCLLPENRAFPPRSSTKEWEIKLLDLATGPFDLFFGTGLAYQEKPLPL